MISAVDFIRIKPVFCGLENEEIQYFLDSSRRQTTVEDWGGNEDTYDEAIIELTAHRLRLERDDHFAQQATQKAVSENQEIKIPKINLELPYLDQTIYGQGYKNLKQNFNGGSSVIA